MTPPAASTTVVIATRNRRGDLQRTLDRLVGLPESPAIVVVDNGSTDGTAATVRDSHPGVRVVELGRNLGSAARNVGARLAGTPYVAFNDDDSWWEPGALAEAERLLAAHPRLGLIAARIVVEPEGKLDPTCRTMATSPLPARPGLAGPAVLGFVACGAVARRSALLEVGGFEERMGIGGEEELLSVELAVAGYDLIYADGVVAHHQPAQRRKQGRQRNVVRNQLLVAWLRRPLLSALRSTGRLLIRHRGDPQAALGAVDAVRAAPWIARERRPVRRPLERALRSLD
jgi:GT2 family glycosyltransferase